MLHMNSVIANTVQSGSTVVRHNSTHSRSLVKADACFGGGTCLRSIEAYPHPSSRIETSVARMSGRKVSRSNGGESAEGDIVLAKGKRNFHLVSRRCVTIYDGSDSCRVIEKRRCCESRLVI